MAKSGGPLYYLDTNAVAKLYHEEPGSDVMETIASSYTAELWIAELTRTEFHSACLCKAREGELEEEALQAVLACFADDVRDRFEIMPWQEDVIDRAINLLLQYGKEHALRTLDAFQLVAAQYISGSEITFVTADKKLESVAEILFNHVVNPEKESTK